MQDGSDSPIDSSAPSRYILTGVGVVTGIVALCALTFFLLSQTFGGQEALPTRAPGLSLIHI